MVESDPFRPAKLLVTLAGPDLDAFEAQCNAFLKDCKVEVVRDDKSHPTQIIGKARLPDKTIPDAMERNAMRLMNEMRSTLDKAVHAAAKLLGSSDLKHAHFPFGESESQFHTQLSSSRGPWGGIPTELHNFLKALRPFWGGNDLLRAFGDFSNPTKHESILTVKMQPGDIGINPGLGGQLTGFLDRLGGAVWNESKTELEIYRASKSRPFNMKVEMVTSIAFNDAKGLTGKDFVPTIRQVMGIVNGIVLGLEAETNRILRERT
jgi:hypothetical protein